MTRFEALGVLPDKKVSTLRPRGNGLWEIARRIPPETLVDELPDEAEFRLVIRNKQPELGFLIRVTTRSDQERIIKTYIRADQRKVKRNAKRFDWKLPKLEVAH